MEEENQQPEATANPDAKDLQDCEEEPRKKKNPQVYLDISMGGSPAGRLVIELYADIVPLTAANFLALCTGEKGTGVWGNRLHYEGTTFHLIHRGLFAEGGDIEKRDGSSYGESIYDGYFDAESFAVKHSERGILSMCRTGSCRIGSKFFISFEPQPFFNGRYVAFGKVVDGWETFEKMERYTTFTGVPLGRVEIVKSGVLEEESNKGIMERSGKRVGSTSDIERKKRRKYSPPEPYSSLSDTDLHLEPDCDS